MAWFVPLIIAAAGAGATAGGFSMAPKRTKRYDWQHGMIGNPEEAGTRSGVFATRPVNILETEDVRERKGAALLKAIGGSLMGSGISALAGAGKGGGTNVSGAGGGGATPTSEMNMGGWTQGSMNYAKQSEPSAERGLYIKPVGGGSLSSAKDGVYLDGEDEDNKIVYYEPSPFANTPSYAKNPRIGVKPVMNYGNISRASDDYNVAVAPNEQWMYPNLSGKTKKVMTESSNEKIAAGLPIPVIDDIIGVAGKGARAAERFMFRPKLNKSESLLVREMNHYLPDAEIVFDKKGNITKQGQKIIDAVSKKLAKNLKIREDFANVILNKEIFRRSARARKNIADVDPKDYGERFGSLFRNPDNVKAVEGNFHAYKNFQRDFPDEYNLKAMVKEDELPFYRHGGFFPAKDGVVVQSKKKDKSYKHLFDKKKDGYHLKKDNYLYMLPEDPYQKEAKGWMRDWIEQRPDQWNKLGFSDAKSNHNLTTKYEVMSAINPVNIGAEIIADKNKSVDYYKKIINKNINSVTAHTYKGSDLPGDAYVPINPHYRPFFHKIWNPRANKSSLIHEIGHASRLGRIPENYNYIQELVQEDPIANKKGFDRYYHNPNEIYSRIWQLRHDNNLKPTDNIKMEDIKAIKNKSDNALFEYLDDNTILELMNNLVKNTDDESETKARCGIKVSAKGRKKAAGGIVAINPIHGPSHEAGGVDMVINGEPIEAEGGEYKINFKDGSKAVFNQEQMARLQAGENPASIIQSMPKAENGYYADGDPYGWSELFKTNQTMPTYKRKLGRGLVNYEKNALSGDGKFSIREDWLKPDYSKYIGGGDTSGSYEMKSNDPNDLNKKNNPKDDLFKRYNKSLGVTLGAGIASSLVQGFSALSDLKRIEDMSDSDVPRSHVQRSPALSFRPVDTSGARRDIERMFSGALRRARETGRSDILPAIFAGGTKARTDVFDKAAGINTQRMMQVDAANQSADMNYEKMRLGSDADWHNRRMKMLSLLSGARGQSMQGVMDSVAGLVNLGGQYVQNKLTSDVIKEVINNGDYRLLAELLNRP